MGWWEAALLGLLQGLTEFLPVSSSAHLVLGQEVLGLETQGNLLFEVFVHLGTALSIVTCYRQRLAGLVKQTLLAVRSPRSAYMQRPEARTGMMILLTMVPTGLIYLLFAASLEAAFANVSLVCAMLLVTGALLVLTVFRRGPAGGLTFWKAILIGFAQSAAFLPGISRAGATICTALYQNVRPETAADFSFLMAVPVIFGAALVEGASLMGTPVQAALLPLVVGMAAAYLSGILAIKVVLRFVRRGSLHYFAYYCFGIGFLGLILL